MAFLFHEKFGPWAIVAGAAEGLGEAYSKALARRKMNLVLIDVKLLEMGQLASRLEANFGVETIQFHLDLRQGDACFQILKATKEIDVGLLVFNAAISHIKPFVNHSPEELDNFVDVNVRTQIQLVHAFTQKLRSENKAGAVLLMSSLSGLIGMQLVAPYAATKAFAWNLAEALYYELKPYNITVMACIAGATATPAYLKTNPKYGLFKTSVMKPEEVAEAALKKLGKQALFIPGFLNRLNYFILTRLLPRKVAAKLANKTIGKMYAHKLEAE